MRVLLPAMPTSLPAPQPVTLTLSDPLPLESDLTPRTSFRWVILTLVFFAITINYIDRMVLGLLADDIKRDFHISDYAYGWITSAFSLSYAFGQSASGRWLDKVGTRAGYALALLGWSFASMAHALARGAISFGIVRGVLGVTESPAYPAATKTLAEWFPKKERAFAMGWVNFGSCIGAIVAPILVSWLAYTFGWRVAFIGTGAVGLCWLVFWVPIYRKPIEGPGRGGLMVSIAWVLVAVLALIAVGLSTISIVAGFLESRWPPLFDWTILAALLLFLFVWIRVALWARGGLSASEVNYINSDPPDAPGKVRWARLLPHRQAWAFAFGKFMTDPIWSFYLFWLPIFYKDKFKLELKGAVGPLVVIYTISGVGGVLGGWLSSGLLKRGASVNVARKTAMLVCGAAALPVLFMSYVTDMWLATALIGIALAAHQGFSSNLYTLVSDTFPKKAVGSVAGLGGTFGYLGTSLFMAFVGWIKTVTNNNYLPIFVICAVGYLIALLVIHFLMPRLTPAQVQFDEEPLAAELPPTT